MDAETEKLLDILETKIPVDNLVSSLTVAQQQLVMIAKALSLQARIIIMDEPSTSLAQKELNRLFSLMNSLVQQGKTIIYISHRMEEIFTTCSRATVLRDGKLVGTVSLREAKQQELIRMMVGDTGTEEISPVPAPGEKEKLLVTKGISQQRKLFNICLNLHRGEVIGLAGLMGAGKTSISRVLFGADVLDSGEIFLQGKAVRLKSPEDAIHHGIYLVPEDRRVQGLFMDMSIQKNIGIANLDRTTRNGFVSRTEEQRISQESVKEFNIITSSIDKIVRFLSGGNQQKVVIAKCLSNRPKIIILDEPTRGIDVGAKEEIYHLISRLTREGAGVIIASSEIPELIRLCDFIYVLFAGRVMDVLSREEATQEKILTLASGISIKNSQIV